MEYESIIGLEVHAELLTKTKIFCSCPAKFGGEPNTHVCEICLGMPGVLPVLNKNVVEFALKSARALNCQILEECKFDRKNYFYPDLPKAYQISQYDKPIAVNGYLEVNVNGKNKKIGITRIHMEEDAGKLVHVGSDRLAGSNYSLVDYNRAGVPLIEIVSEPDMRTSEDAKSYMEELRNILLYIGVCDGKMQEGSLRCDANVSVRKKGSQKFSTKVEIKNLNSFKSLQRAIDYEISRQIEELESGGKIVQETRLWDENNSCTISMRVKEEAEDYRYFPEPDLVSLFISKEWIKNIDDNLPELPKAKRERYINQLGLSEYDAVTIVNSIELMEFFEETLKLDVNPKLVANWLMGDISAILKDEKIELKDSKLKPEMLKEMIELIEKGTISGKIAKEILPEILKYGKSPSKIIEEKGLVQINDESEIVKIVKSVIEKNPNQVQQFLNGKEKVIGFLVGQTMKESKGKANPELVNKILLNQLNSLKK
jgi:aspartyl-tRNA(Asn)/glutamyl-tRNA(Gln) amidotransferase subunit B